MSGRIENLQLELGCDWSCYDSNETIVSQCLADLPEDQQAKFIGSCCSGYWETETCVWLREFCTEVNSDDFEWPEGTTDEEKDQADVACEGYCDRANAANRADFCSRLSGAEIAVIVIFVLLVVGGVTGVLLYCFVFKKRKEEEWQTAP
jgi:hypothetical protein